MTCAVFAEQFSIVFYCSFQSEVTIVLLKILRSVIMNKAAKCRVLMKIYQLEDMLTKLTSEVKECYEFGRRSGEFFEVGDLVGFFHPVAVAGCVVQKGEVEEVYTDKRKIKVYCRHYPGVWHPMQHITFIVRYELVFLIKGTDSDEECVLPDDLCKIEDLEVCDD